MQLRGYIMLQSTKYKILEKGKYAAEGITKSCLLSLQPARTWFLLINDLFFTLALCLCLFCLCLSYLCLLYLCLFIYVFLIDYLISYPFPLIVFFFVLGFGVGFVLSCLSLSILSYLSLRILLSLCLIRLSAIMSKILINRPLPEVKIGSHNVARQCPRRQVARKTFSFSKVVVPYHY